MKTVQAISFLLVFSRFLASFGQSLRGNDKFNPYEVLDVPQDSTLKVITNAFKRKTWEMNEPWFKELGHETGVQRMKNITKAFEVLSLAETRKKYDETGIAEVSPLITRKSKEEEDKKEAATVWKKKSIFNQNFRRMGTQILKDRPEVQMAQARLVHVTSNEQLEALVMDDHGRFERNLLLCFVKPGPAKDLAEDVILYPHPYAGGFSRFGLWWENLIQSLEVVVEGPNEITNNFGMDDIIEHSDKPVFVFMRRGGHYMDDIKHHIASKQTEFEDWVMETLNDIQVHVEFVNNHDHAVELVYIEGKFQKVLGTIEAGETHKQKSYLFHEFAVRDARVDKFEGAPNATRLTLESCLDSWLLDTDRSPMTLTIDRVACMDLSGDCGMWFNKGFCSQENANFTMSDQYCRQTCNLCSRNDPLPPLEPEL